MLGGRNSILRDFYLLRSKSFDAHHWRAVGWQTSLQVAGDWPPSGCYSGCSLGPEVITALEAMLTNKMSRTKWQPRRINPPDQQAAPT